MAAVDDIRRDRLAGMSYEDLHVKYFSPVSACGCAACDRGREWERAEEALDKEP